MSTKSKPGKTAAKSAATQNDVLAETPKEKPREVSEISRLVSRYKWLSADQEYQGCNAATVAESERLYCIHEGELSQIAKQLAEAEPESFNDVCGLLDFALAEIAAAELPACTVQALKNVREYIGIIWRHGEHRVREEAEKKTYAELRSDMNLWFVIIEKEMERKRKGAP